MDSLRLSNTLPGTKPGCLPDPSQSLARIVDTGTRYVRVVAGDRSARVERGSVAHRLVGSVLGSGLNCFSSRDLVDITGIPISQVSNTLYRLYNRNVLSRTERRVWLDSESPEYIYGFVLDPIDLEPYVLSHLAEEPDLCAAYLAISRSMEPFSSIEVREEFDTDPQGLRTSFVAAGLLGAEKVHVSGQWWEWFYYSNQTDACERIGEKVSRLSLLHAESVAKGYRLEKRLYKAFRELMHSGDLSFRLVDVRRQVRKKVAGHNRIFDLVLYFAPFLGENPVKYASKRLVLVVEAKDTMSVGGAVMNQHKLDVDQAYPSQGIPVLAATNPTQSAFNVFTEYPSLILTGKQLDSILTHSSREELFSEKSRCKDTPLHKPNLVAPSAENKETSASSTSRKPAAKNPSSGCSAPDAQKKQKEPGGRHL